MQTQLAMPELAYVVGGLLLTTIIFLILFVRQVIISQRLTNENETDHTFHVARTVEATKERDKWKNEATTLKAEKEALSARSDNLLALHETDTLTFGRELRAAQDERDYFKKEMETARARHTTAKQDVDDAYKTLESVNEDRDELNRKCNTLAGMVRTLTDKLAEMNAAIDSLTGKRGKGARDASGRFIKVQTTVDPQKEYKTVRSVTSLKRKECIKVNNEAERDAVLRLFEDAGVTWPPLMNLKTTEYTGYKLPTCFFYDKKFLQVGTPLFAQNDKRGYTILPASDFIDVPAPTPVKQLRNVVKEMGKPETIEPTEQKDHPCLKGCRRPKGCKCPDGAPKGGSVLVTHTKSDLIVMGVALDVNDISDFNKEATILEPWAKQKGMKFFGRAIKGSTHGTVDVSYKFHRPAVNSDFDIPKANA